ncbi:FecR domain-containing protein [Methylomonas fluvii]|uniref:FecR domain-containing protein n=1 Tax=Methylomonas fluvii TaxID=1854564 RepID=A0ABR9DBC1_9GAMM|nr:FecR domain-containing protein [Methylomonas fluvii]MBD9360406.1 FecR domain-containing protein [Methylomonas fluvii]CAD6873218.1 anti-FecI sigma factor FecR [Methylomonas fluvii]
MPSGDRQKIHPRVVAEAAEWFMVLSSGSVRPEETAQWQAWLALHPDHQMAWARVEFYSGKLKSLPPQAAFATTAALNAPNLNRRRMLLSMAMFGLAGMSGWQISRGRYWQEWLADQHTALGESKIITLTDGSTVVLDSGSALNVDFSVNFRRLQLVKGEIYIETAPDTVGWKRPFVVDTPEGRVLALGTRFSVSQQENRTQVTVFQDAVEIQPTDTTSAKQTLRAGQQAQFAANHIESIYQHNQDRPAWTQGFIVADDLPLSEFLLQLSRYRPSYITCAPEIADLRIIGSYPLKDTDKILAFLEANLPVKLSHPLPFWVKVLPR